MTFIPEYAAAQYPQFQQHAQIERQKIQSMVGRTENAVPSVRRRATVPSPTQHSDSVMRRLVSSVFGPGARQDPSAVLPRDTFASMRAGAAAGRALDSEVGRMQRGVANPNYARLNAIGKLRSQLDVSLRRQIPGVDSRANIRSNRDTVSPASMTNRSAAGTLVSLVRSVSGNN